MVTLKEEVQVNGDKLRQLREERGWDWGQVARLSSLSLAQVEALETGSTACFYSLSIRNNAARKVAQVMGAAEADVFMTRHVSEAAPAGGFESVNAPISVPVDRRSFQPVTQPSSWMGYGVMSLFLVSGMAWYGLHSETPNSLAGGLLASAPVAPARLPVADPTSLITSAEAAVPAQTPGVVAVAQAAPLALAPVSESTPARPQDREFAPASVLASAEPSCPFEGDVAELEAAHPTKTPEKVTLMFHKAGALCVQDSTGKIWQEELKPWLGRTFVGKAPWKLYSPALPYADVYFQGEKIKLATLSSRAIALNGKQLNR